MKNFGYDELVIINPRASLGIEAMMYAKHADDILQNARVVDSFEEAVKGCYPIIGTTASFEKGRRGLIKLVPLSELKVNLENAAIVFGSEDNGLNKEDLQKCDIVTYIETSEKYPSLNLSNAAAVVLYHLRRMQRVKEENTIIEPRSVEKMKELLSDIIKDIEGLRNPKKCERAFKNVIARAKPDKEETNSIICIFKGILKKMEK